MCLVVTVWSVGHQFVDPFNAGVWAYITYVSSAMCSALDGFGCSEHGQQGHGGDLLSRPAVQSTACSRLQSQWLEERSTPSLAPSLVKIVPASIRKKKERLSRPCLTTRGLRTVGVVWMPRSLRSTLDCGTCYRAFAQHRGRRILSTGVGKPRAATLRDRPTRLSFMDHRTSPVLRLSGNLRHL